jgi:hypothetical protein
MATCLNIDKNILIDCAHPPVGGANDRLILIPFETYNALTVTKDINNPLLITNIGTISPVPGYVYEGQNQSNGAITESRKLTYQTVYDHSVLFRVFDNYADTKEQLQRLGQKKVVAIVENNFRGEDGKGAFEVYGSKVGLELETLIRDLNDADTQGIFDIELKNNESTPSPTMPENIWNTDYVTTKAIIDALVSV